MTNPARPSVRSIAITFVVALLFYVLAYGWLTRRQTTRGPWEVAFTTNAAGFAQLAITQPALGISNIHVTLSGERPDATNTLGTVRFENPKMPVPFGRMIFDDLMFLPGTVTLDVFGHEVELLPRTLVLNRKAVGWTNGAAHVLEAAMKLPPEVRAKTKGGYRP
jgi:hypothetical protein